MTTDTETPTALATLNFRRAGDNFEVWDDEIGLRFSGCDTPANRADLAGFAKQILVERGQLPHYGEVELVEAKP